MWNHGYACYESTSYELVDPGHACHAFTPPYEHDNPHCDKIDRHEKNEPRLTPSEPHMVIDLFKKLTGSLEEEAEDYAQESSEWIAEYIKLRSLAFDLMVKAHHNLTSKIALEKMWQSGWLHDINEHQTYAHPEIVLQLQNEFHTSTRRWTIEFGEMWPHSEICSAPPVSPELGKKVTTLRAIILRSNAIANRSISKIDYCNHSIEAGRVITTRQLEMTPIMIENYLRLKHEGDARNHKQIMADLIRPSRHCPSVETAKPGIANDHNTTLTSGDVENTCGANYLNTNIQPPTTSIHHYNRDANNIQRAIPETTPFSLATSVSYNGTHHETIGAMRLSIPWIAAPIPEQPKSSRICIAQACPTPCLANHHRSLLTAFLHITINHVWCSLIQCISATLIIQASKGVPSSRPERKPTFQQLTESQPVV